MRALGAPRVHSCSARQFLEGRLILHVEAKCLEALKSVQLLVEIRWFHNMCRHRGERERFGLERVSADHVRLLERSNTPMALFVKVMGYAELLSCGLITAGCPSGASLTASTVTWALAWGRVVAIRLGAVVFPARLKIESRTGVLAVREPGTLRMLAVSSISCRCLLKDFCTMTNVGTIPCPDVSTKRNEGHFQSEYHPPQSG